MENNNQDYFSNASNIMSQISHNLITDNFMPNFISKPKDNKKKKFKRYGQYRKMFIFV